MIKDVESLLDSVCADIRSRCDVAVVGLSGGADSTLVALLAVQALGKQNVYGVHMPGHDSDTQSDKFNARSIRLAFALGIKECNAPVMLIASEINNAVFQAVRGFFPHDVTTLNAGNARSRARMTVLYGISHHLNDYLNLKDTDQPNLRARVVGTGNMSEDFIGYDTKGGDALCDFFPIGDLFKSEVYQLLDHFKRLKIIDESMIDRVPSAGLWAGQTDEGELGYTYNEMEPIIRDYLGKDMENTFIKSPIGSFVRHRHLQNKHKHEAPPVTPLREYCE